MTTSAAKIEKSTSNSADPAEGQKKSEKNAKRWMVLGLIAVGAATVGLIIKSDHDNKVDQINKQKNELVQQAKHNQQQVEQAKHEAQRSNTTGLWLAQHGITQTFDIDASTTVPKVTLSENIHNPKACNVAFDFDGKQLILNQTDQAQHIYHVVKITSGEQAQTDLADICH